MTCYCIWKCMSFDILAWIFYSFFINYFMFLISFLFTFPFSFSLFYHPSSVFPNFVSSSHACMCCSVLCVRASITKHCFVKSVLMYVTFFFFVQTYNFFVLFIYCIEIVSFGYDSFGGLFFILFENTFKNKVPRRFIAFESYSPLSDIQKWYLTILLKYLKMF